MNLQSLGKQNLGTEWNVTQNMVTGTRDAFEEKNMKVGNYIRPSETLSNFA